MKTPSPFALVRRPRWLVLALLLAGAVADRPAGAYPPAPFHLFYGMLRDEYGTPISLPEAEVVLETSSGVAVKTRVIAGIETAANYRLEVPMDAGLLAKPYQPTALRPLVPFRVKVKIGRTTYLPIETAGDFAHLGQPGQRTRLNLTLGEDANGDGLPDAWQRLVNADLSQVKPDADAGNGLTYLETYLAGTYAVSPTNGFALNIVGVSNGAPQLEFTAVTGRTYSLLGSTDLDQWRPLAFRLSTDATNAAQRASYYSDTVKTVRIEAAPAETGVAPTFFRLMLQ